MSRFLQILDVDAESLPLWDILSSSSLVDPKFVLSVPLWKNILNFGVCQNFGVFPKAIGVFKSNEMQGNCLSY